MARYQAESRLALAALQDTDTVIVELGRFEAAESRTYNSRRAIWVCQLCEGVC